MRWGGLFFKYVVLFVGLVTGVLVINAALDLYFVYQENRRASIEVQREKAEAAAQRVESFVREIERMIGWVAYPQFAALPAEQRRFDYVRLLRLVPAITEVVQLDRQGREQLRVSRLSMDVVGAGTDRSAEPAFVEAMANKVYFGPVYYRKESEPYLTMAVVHGVRSGVTVVEINLKLILDVITRIKIGRDGYTYVVDQKGRLIAHPDISLVLRGTDMSRLSQVADALAPQSGGGAPEDTRNRSGISVLSAHAAIPALGWLVFVELPTWEAQQPVIDAGLRTLALLVLGLIIAGLAGALLARRMVVPIRTLQAGAARIGSGELGHRLSIKTGDELEALADQFNRSAGALEESHATLEQRVEDRTRELSESLEQQTATAGILRVISQSPTDVEPVLRTVADAAAELCRADEAAVFLFRDGAYRWAASANINSAYIEAVRGEAFTPGTDSLIGRTALLGKVVQIEDAISDPEYGRKDLAQLGGVHTLLGIPLQREGAIIGVMALTRRHVEAFSDKHVEILQVFADQAVIAIQNVRLFTELRESLEQQTATAEILRAISQSPTDVQPVLDVVVKAAVRFCGAEDAHVFLREGDEMVSSAHEGPLSAHPLGYRDALDATITARAQSIIEARVTHVVDTLSPEAEATYALIRENSIRHGFRAQLNAPMLRDGRAIGCICLRRQEPGAFTPRQIELLETFAAQAVIAIENVRLFTEIQEKSRQLEVASQHKSQFLANMSHELRTPLNAIIGYTEMMADGLYGEVGEKATGVLERVQNNGRHLLGLINDVLDLSKIEAGQLTLTVEPYSVADMVATVLSATESLARTKKLDLGSAVAPGLPTGSGDARRLTQVLLNLVGNAIKFTDQGSVEVRAAQVGDVFELSVVDSGFGIAPADQARIFDEFQQVDNSSTRKKGGTGLGLSISRKIVELHGGRITVESEVGKGSTFKVTVPINVAPVKDAAE
jgi:signal transduction histidine kinase